MTIIRLEKVRTEGVIKGGLKMIYFMPLIDNFQPYGARYPMQTETIPE